MLTAAFECQQKDQLLSVTISAPVSGSARRTSVVPFRSAGSNSSQRARTTPLCLNAQRAATLYFLQLSGSKEANHHSISRLKLRHSDGSPDHVGTLYHEEVPLSSSAMMTTKRQGQKWPGKTKIVKALAKRSGLVTTRHPSWCQQGEKVGLEHQAMLSPIQIPKTRIRRSQRPGGRMNSSAMQSAKARLSGQIQRRCLRQ